MNTRGYTVGTYIIKSQKKNSELPICPTCKKCKNKSICQNRKNKKEMTKCTLCKNCKDIGKCDKFYINIQHKATLTIGKDIKTGEAIRKSFTGKTQEEALDKMYKYKLEVQKTGKNVELKRTEKTIAILAKEIEDSKYRMGKTKANAYNTNISTLERIKKYKFANIPIEKVTKKQIEDFLQDERIKSNSTIKKDYRMLKYVYEYEYANYKLYLVNNYFEGINRIEIPKSLKEDKDVVALTITEQNKLEDYLATHNSMYKNIILMCLYTGMRIGEVLSLNYNDDIDLENKMIRITKTLTKDRNKKTIIGQTKSGKRNIEINELTEDIIKEALDNKIENTN